MSQAKFEIGEKVMVDGKEAIVEVSQKNFSTQIIRYKLKDHPEMVDEDDIKRVGNKRKETAATKTATKSKKLNKKEMEALRELYKELALKDVPSNKKNDATWIQSKVTEMEMNLLHGKYKEVVGEMVPEDKLEDVSWINEQIREHADPFETLNVLDFEQLKLLVIEKELDIDVEDYEEKDDLLEAVCDELDIEIPE